MARPVCTSEDCLSGLHKQYHVVITFKASEYVTEQCQPITKTIIRASERIKGASIDKKWDELL